MSDRESRGVTLLTGTAQVLGAPAAQGGRLFVAAPTAGVPGTMRQSACMLSGQAARLPVVTD